MTEIFNQVIRKVHIWCPVKGVKGNTVRSFTNSVAAPATVGEKCLSYATRKGKAAKHADTQARKPAIYGRYFLQAGCTVEDGISVTDDE